MIYFNVIAICTIVFHTYAHTEVLQLHMNKYYLMASTAEQLTP